MWVAVGRDVKRCFATSALPLTPDHAIPEQLRGDPVTTSTDIFQIGVLIFELLTGQLPYRTADRSAAAPLVGVGLLRLLRRGLLCLLKNAQRSNPDRDWRKGRLRFGLLITGAA
jgi:serine/threonine protein kinase